MRTSIKTTCDLSVADNKRRLISAVGAMSGMYEVEIQPRRDTRTLRQNSLWWVSIIQPFYQFLREQDYDVTTTEDAHAILKEKFLRVAVVNRDTGEEIGWRTLSTAKLTTEEFSDLYERARMWLEDQFGIIVENINEQVSHA